MVGDKLRLGVLASGRGSNLQAIVEACESGRIQAVVAVVVSDRREAEALRRAERRGLRAVWLDPKACENREAYDRQVARVLQEHKVDLVVLAGYMRLCGPALLDAFPWRVLNIHPALLPSFPGKDGQGQALEHGVKVSGCTVHFVDGGTDTGPIILQKTVPVLEGDTADDLAGRILAVEHKAYPEAIQLYAEGRLRVVDGKRVEVLPPGSPGHAASPAARRRRALLSVHDKTGLVDFARGLIDAGYELISSGGTAKTIREAGLPAISVEDVTGFPEMLDGRVKTLHPVIHGGILARRDIPSHMDALARRDIAPIDLVAVNLYPFQETVNGLSGDAGEAESFALAVENIDIGGPTLIRSAAKNHESVVVVTDPSQYPEILGYLRDGGEVPGARRRELALAAFRHTAFYDAVIAAYLAGMSKEESHLPARLVLAYEKAMDLRYGENPQQEAAFYRHPLRRTLAALGPTIPGARQLQGKDLSFNNIADAEAALAVVREFDEPAAVALKHMNPCGAAVAPDIRTAYRLAHDSDPVSIFGGIVALNRRVEAELARELARIFLEVVLAPDFTPEALEILSRKADLRLLVLPAWSGQDAGKAQGGVYEARTVKGGLLVQSPDTTRLPPEAWRVVTARGPTREELRDLHLAWRVVKHVKSNAIVLARAGQLVGVGAGQMNRVDSARLATGHAGERARGAAMASDAFFPFPDSIEVAAAAGVTAVVHPGGSLRDVDSVKAADAAGMAMLVTGERHFRH